ncbi:MAG: hypothetical protein AAGB93_21765, partial [Planctomycetota bacterium]
MTPSRRSRCRAHRSTLDAVLDGRVAQEARQALELHAADCESCARALDESLSLRAALDALPTPEPDRASEDAFVDAVMGRIDRAASAGPAPVDSGRRAAAIAAWSVAAGLVAAALLAWITLRAPASKSGPEQGPGRGPETAQRIAALAPEAGPRAAGPRALGPRGRGPAGAQAASALPPVVLETQGVVGRNDLEAALADLGEGSSFDPAALDDAGPFLASVRGRVDGDVAPAARAILAEIPPSGHAPRAGRGRGPPAHPPDRDRLVDAIDTVGAPAAIALVDRGMPGVRRLWAVAAGEGVEAVPIARATLRALVVEGRSVSARVPSDVPLEIVAPILSSHPTEGASVALEGFLETGDPSWLAALESHPRSSDAVAERARARVGPRERDRELLLRAIRSTGSA